MAESVPDHTPEHWRKCAEEVRKQAREIRDPVVKREMEMIAQGYDRLASHAAKRRSSGRGKK